MTLNVLLVEDETLVALELEETIQSLGRFHVVAKVKSGEEALSLVEREMPDIVLMDIRLEGEMDGIETARRMRGLPPKIIFLTAFSDIAHIEAAAGLSPTAYLIKPIDTRELHAALILASEQGAQNESLPVSSTLHYLTRARELIDADGKVIELTDLEKRFLELLLERRGAILSFYEMESLLWPGRFPGESTRRSLVKRLRDKIGRETVLSLSGQGYRLNIPK
jgi:DNA-binding response OmpR family regulator